MPTIEITPEQAQALARGESVTLAPEPPEVRLFNASVILRGESSQRWHRCNLEGTDAQDAAQRWAVRLSRSGSDDYDYDGAIIAVCERRTPGDRAYMLDTMDARYFRVKRSPHGPLVVLRGV